MKLIDKDVLVAEIERRLYFDNNWIEGDKRRQKHTDGISSAYYKRVGSKHACESILDFVNTLEVKEVDLEKELIEWHKEHFKKDGTFIGMSGFYLTNNSQMAIAKHFFELGLKTKLNEKNNEDNR